MSYSMSEGAPHILSHTHVSMMRPQQPPISHASYIQHNRHRQPFGFDNMDQYSNVDAEGELDSGMDLSILNAEEHGDMNRLRHRNLESLSDDGHEKGRKGDSKKTRGRPRLDTRDENAADRRRTQIRLAQRAYRLRKETTISSLKNRVTQLEGSIEGMQKAFLQLHDAVLTNNVLTTFPEMGNVLRETTDNFIGLARLAQNPQDGEEDTDNSEQGRSSRTPSERGSMSHSAPTSQPFLGNGQNPTQLVDFHLARQDAGGGNRQLQPPAGGGTPRNTAVVNTGFGDPMLGETDFLIPDSILDQLMPSIPDFINTINTPISPSLPASLPAPMHFEHLESSFSRRLHRASLRYAVALLVNPRPDTAEINRVFRFSLALGNKEQLVSIIRSRLARPAPERLDSFTYPFGSVGGSGANYPKALTAWDSPTANRGYFPGAATWFTSLGERNEAYKIIPLLSGVEDEYLDPEDVEALVESRGITLVEDVDALPSSPPPLPASSFLPPIPHRRSSMPGLSDTSAQSSGDEHEHNTGSGDSYTPMIAGSDKSSVSPREALSHSFSAASILGTSKNIDPVLVSSGSADSESMEMFLQGFTNTEAMSMPALNKVSVGVLIHEVVKRSVCLGRTPGIKRQDAELAILIATGPRV